MTGGGGKCVVVMMVVVVVGLGNGRDTIVTNDNGQWCWTHNKGPGICFGTEIGTCTTGNINPIIWMMMNRMILSSVTRRCGGGQDIEIILRGGGGGGGFYCIF